MYVCVYMYIYIYIYTLYQAGAAEPSVAVLRRASAACKPYTPNLPTNFIPTNIA